MQEYALQLYHQLEARILANPDKVKEMQGDVPKAAQRLWTCADRLGAPDHDLQFCSLLNAALRMDAPALVAPAAVLCRAINMLCVERRKASSVRFPPEGVCWRGGGLPVQHHAFYSQLAAQYDASVDAFHSPDSRRGKYRVPGFLATSFSHDVAWQFMYEAWREGRGPPCVLWRISVHPEGGKVLRHRVKHVNFVERSEVQQDEQEYLFAPYSVFTVTKVEWADKMTPYTPHIVHLVAATDNRFEPEDLPLAPWY